MTHTFLNKHKAYKTKHKNSCKNAIFHFREILGDALIFFTTYKLFDKGNTLFGRFLFSTINEFKNKSLFSEL